MAEKEVGIRMASATKEDIKNLYLLHNLLENFSKYDASSMDDFEHFEEEEKKFISQIFDEDGLIDADELIQYLYGLMHGFHRVVMGYEVMYDNCANKDLDYLDFNKEIKLCKDLWNHLENHLKAGREICITPDSVLGKVILGNTDGKEVKDEDGN